MGLPELQEQVRAARAEEAGLAVLGEQLCLDTLLIPRPKVRGDCMRSPRPCPFVSCRHHLYLDVLPEGEVRFNFPLKESWELEHTCSLDIADDNDAHANSTGETALLRVGTLLNVPGEVVREIEGPAIAKLKALRW